MEIINSKLIGTGACIPDFVLTNAMREKMVDTNDEWIVQRTGVRERRIAKNTHTWELALGAAQDALADAGITAEEIDWVVPHQANLRILDVIARRYHLPKEKIYVNMDRFGNTSSASVPICLNEMRKNGLLHEGQTIVCTGFGGGLTYGAFVLKL